MSEQQQPQSSDPNESSSAEDNSAPSPTVLPRDLTYNAETVENPEEVLSRPNVTPQPQGDNERAF